MTNDLRNEAGTPRALFEVLHRDYGFTIDVCATARNTKLPDYITPDDDALACSWAGERAWCNPPFKLVPAFLAHAPELLLAVYLVPCRTDRAWWMWWKPLAEVHWFVGESPHRRIQYEAPPGVKYSSNPACECLMCFGEGFAPGRERWRSGRTGEIMEGQCPLCTGAHSLDECGTAAGGCNG